jgi:response regulator RpfG family c-di-GMP phosphodiesterase
MHKQSGKQFDPECVNGFETIRERIIQETRDRLANRPEPIR